MKRRRPLIGCTTYRKTAGQDPPIDLFGLMPSYINAIQATGAIPILIPLGLTGSDLEEIFDRVDGILLPGGGDVLPHRYHADLHPTMWGLDDDRDRVEFHLSQLAVKHEKPLLAICRGVQVFNVALGGTLWQDIPSQMPGAVKHDYIHKYPRHHLAHEVAIRPGSRMAAYLGVDRTPVNSLHHQGIRDLAPILDAVAVAPDGLAEGVEVRDHRFALGVQWHPEALLENVPNMACLFQGLVEAAAG